MIATLEGTVDEKSIDRVLINVGGIGYEVYANRNSLAVIETGKSVKLFIREQIKEDAHDLFGFTALSEKQLFEKLLSVKNVGPKVAMEVLNIGDADTLKRAIAEGDAGFLQSAKGVGRRAAEQIIVELRDKVGLIASDSADAIASRPGIGLSDDAVEALISLGYSAYDARSALASVSNDLPVEDRVKEALKGSGR